jgi:hypothetical protein
MRSKFIFILILFSFCHISFGQSLNFKTEWDTIQKCISYIDTSANILGMQKQRCHGKKQKLKFYNLYDKYIQHCVSVKYKNGNVTARHSYRQGKELSIKVLTVNGIQVYIKTNYRQQIIKSSLLDKGVKKESRFVYIGNNKWYWTRKTNEPGVWPTRETINNWH